MSNKSEETIETWDGPVLLATFFQISPCMAHAGEPGVGVNLASADQTFFAHAHVSLEVAMRMQKDIEHAIAEARSKLS